MNVGQQSIKMAQRIIEGDTVSTPQIYSNEIEQDILPETTPAVDMPGTLITSNNRRVVE